MDAGLIRLAKDGIREAICEVRFEAQGSPEITIGRLTDASVWREWDQVRLSSADIPEQLRATDESLRYAPSYQLTNPGNSLEFVRVGANVVSCHRIAPYPGWDQFGPTVEATLGALFATIRAVKITRVGFRYVNTLSQSEHHVGGVADLNVVLRAGEYDPGRAFVLVYSKELTVSHDVQVSIATPKFVQSPDGTDFDVLIDIDVSSSKGTALSDLAAASVWVDEAHIRLKEEFFTLIPEHVMDKLRV